MSMIWNFFYDFKGGLLAGICCYITGKREFGYTFYKYPIMGRDTTTIPTREFSPRGELLQTYRNISSKQYEPIYSNLNISSLHIHTEKRKRLEICGSENGAKKNEFFR